MSWLDSLESAISQYVYANYTSGAIKDYAKSAGINLENIKPKKLSPVAAERMEKAAKDFAEMLYRAQVAAYDSSLGQGVGKRYMPLVGKVETSADGRFVVRVEYNGDALHRPSYNPDSEGVDNILNLLNTGYKVEGWVPYKLVRSRSKSGKFKKMFARRQRDAMGFFDAAISEFKLKYPEYDIVPDDDIALSS